MQLTMLKSKIHQAMVTGAFPDYPGSLAIDSELIKEAGMLPHEKILVANLENGERFETYIIPATSGSRQIELNGAAALKGKTGDRIIIIAFVTMDAKEAESWVPKVLVMEGENQIARSPSS
jgi:aspartate 1-decarboxylase